MDETGLKKTTVADIANVLKMGLEDALLKGLIPKNPAKLSSKRTPGKREARFMTQEEIGAFLRAAEGNRFEHLFCLLLHTGLRPGEALGLPWDAIDLEGGKLTVRQALHEEDGRMFIGDVKSHAARRTIKVPTAALAAWKRQQSEQLDAILDAKGKWRNEHNLVFTDRTGGFVRRTNLRRRELKYIKEQSAIGV